MPCVPTFLAPPPYFRDSSPLSPNNATRPLARRGFLKLFVYSPKKRLVAFRSDVSRQTTPVASSSSSWLHRKHAVFIPGLTNGLLAPDYVPALAAALNGLGYSFVQPILSSSYKGYGTSSLRQDVDELDELLDHLVSEARPPQPPSDVDGAKIQPRDDIVLIGHSTGCQDSVFYMKHGRPDLRRRVKGVVLQAPVSDREGLAILPETEAMIEVAKARLGGDELMPANAMDAPVTPARFLSLTTKDGDDDMFSSDLSVEELQSRLGHMAFVPTAAFLSEADEYVPPGGVRSPPERFADWFRRALSDPGPAKEIERAAAATTAPPNGEEVGPTKKTVAREPLVRVIEGGNHALSGESHKLFVKGVEGFVSSLMDTVEG